MNRKNEIGIFAMFLIIAVFVFGIYIINASTDKRPTESSYVELTNFKPGELLPCPCCGGIGKLHGSTIDEREYYVECKGCGLQTDYYKGATEYDAKMVATRAWNMRFWNNKSKEVM